MQGGGGDDGMAKGQHISKLESISAYFIFHSMFLQLFPLNVLPQRLQVNKNGIL